MAINPQKIEDELIYLELDAKIVKTSDNKIKKLPTMTRKETTKLKKIESKYAKQDMGIIKELQDLEFEIGDSNKT